MRWFWLAVLLPSLGAAETFQAEVVSISDGDTFWVLTEEKQRIHIRMADIDTPEPGQAFYKRAKQSLGDLIFREVVTLDCRKKKSFSRPVCLVWLGDDNINLTQIQLGMAWWERGFAHEQTAEQQTAYEQSESLAREQGMGLWGDTNPIPPWEFRKQRRRAKVTH